LIDEAWLMGKRPNAENMLREACGGLASRPEGFVIWLSTQSDEAPSGVFKQKLDYARGVRDGRIDDNRFLPVLYEFPEAVLKGYKGGLTRDAWKPYDVLEEVIHQLDLLHVNRWLERGEIEHRIEPRTLLSSKVARLIGPGRPPEEYIEFAEGIRAFLKEAIVFTEREPPPTMKERKEMYNHSRKRMKAFLAGKWTDVDAVRISKELRARFDMIFPFIIHPEISWNNNDAERGIRKGVLHRKVSGGRRTWTGAGVLERLLTISETAKKRGRNIIESFQNALQIGNRPSSTS
jgi:hypothetical protein